jgi:A/G-specific adenine glycosylase
MGMPAPLPSTDKIIQGKILTWYRKNQRSLQWRSTTDPYHILVSEVMLQQTQVARVQEKLPLFLGTFPTLRRLASATTAEVVRAWSGLGYNNRSIRLRNLARIVVDEHGSSIPSDPTTLLQLPGIGPYTAHALACFAYGKRVPLVDTNVRRLFSRLFWKMRSASQTIDDDVLWKKAAQILPPNAYMWNQAIMDLGAVICTASSPSCDTCPVAAYCRSRNVQPAPRFRSAHNEPHYHGYPRRIWRGKIVQRLRALKERKSISIHTLGKAVRPGFHLRELVWLGGIIDQLHRDGIVEQPSRGRVRLASK